MFVPVLSVKEPEFLKEGNDILFIHIELLA
jgi:hypothetical protein